MMENCDSGRDRELETAIVFKVLTVEVSETIFFAESLGMKGEMLNKRVNQAKKFL
jgi:hypothetical protein